LDKTVNLLETHRQFQIELRGTTFELKTLRCKIFALKSFTKFTKGKNSPYKTLEVL